MKMMKVQKRNNVKVVLVNATAVPATPFTHYCRRGWFLISLLLVRYIRTFLPHIQPAVCLKVIAHCS